MNAGHNCSQKSHEQGISHLFCDLNMNWRAALLVGLSLFLQTLPPSPFLQDFHANFFSNCHDTILRFLQKRIFFLIHPYGHIKYPCSPPYFPASFAVRLRHMTTSVQLVVSCSDQFHFRDKGFKSQFGSSNLSSPIRLTLRPCVPDVDYKIQNGNQTCIRLCGSKK